ncbi:hypothetical protein OAP27_02345 [Candidatus Pseudothioglobus singularis]|nr:hypothetical protein [Candidatus Pseudothioglobus singularis]
MKIMFLVYKNRYNEVKAYTVDAIAQDETYLDVFDIQADRIKTFRKSNILSIEDKLEVAEFRAKLLQKDYQIIERKKRTANSKVNNIKGALEVCFTGFPKDEKSELIKYVNDNGLIHRKSITKNLGLLVCGKTAGWKKIETANKYNVPRVFGADGFYNFLETGEFTA